MTARRAHKSGSPYRAGPGSRCRTVGVVEISSGVRRDQFAAFMVAERDAELRGAGPFEVEQWPDIDDRQRPAVELIGRDAQGIVVAVEHTVIESYHDQIAERKALELMFRRGGPEIAELEDAAQFRVIVRIEELLAIRRNERPLVGPAVAAWVRSALPSVPWPHRPGEPTYVRGRLSRPSLEVSLERWTAAFRFVGPLARVMRVGFWRPVDLEERRQARLAEAVRQKVPKLLAAADQARTILVLEDRDMYMSAPAFVSRAMAALEAADLPDVIYLLNVTAGDPLLTPIYMDGNWSHNHDRGLMTFPPQRAAQFNGLAV